MNLREFLDLYMDHKLRLTDLELATRLGYSSNSPVSMVRRGERSIAEDKVSEWADALGLIGKEREEFFELAHLELAPTWLQQQYFRLKGRIDQLEKSVDSLQARYADLVSERKKERS